MTDDNDSILGKADLEYKIILLGDTSVGKTCLFKRITVDVFKEKSVSTIGIDKKTFKLKCDLTGKDGDTSTKIVDVILTDTAGQERYRAMTKTYYKSSEAALILYDITKKNTFENINDWIQSINTSTLIDKNKYVIFVMGTKIDLVESGKREREVTEEEAIEMCQKNKVEWGGECSNKEYSLEKLKGKFKGFIQILYEKFGDQKKEQASVVLSNFKKKRKPKQKGCCG